MKRKVLSALLCSAMVVGMLAGCGQAQSTSGTSAAAPAEGSSTGTSEAASAEGASADTTSASATAASVDYSKDSGDIYMFISSPEYADAINTLIDQYKSVAPNVTINYETTQNDYPTMLKAKINSGEVPDIFSSTSGKEIDTYREYSYDLSKEALMNTIDPAVADTMKSPELGTGCYGIAIKGNYFGMVYNKDILNECGVTEFPTTQKAMIDACEKIAAKGYKPFTTGYSEWWVFKHVWQHFLDAAAKDAGMEPAELVAKFEKGEAKISDYPELYTNSAEEAAFGNGKAAMVVGQGAWIEGDVKAINDKINIGFNGYPVTDDAAQCQVIAGSDQALHVNKDSKNLQATLDFINWWYTSDYGMSWFTDVAGVVPPIETDAKSDYAIIQQGNELSASVGAAPLAVCYSTDSWHQTFGQLMQAYIAGTTDKDATCDAIQKQWQAIDGASN